MRLKPDHARSVTTALVSVTSLPVPAPGQSCRDRTSAGTAR
jgi:hypothetical protein